MIFKYTNLDSTKYKKENRQAYCSDILISIADNIVGLPSAPTRQD